MPSFGGYGSLFRKENNPIGTRIKIGACQYLECEKLACGVLQWSLIVLEEGYDEECDFCTYTNTGKLSFSNNFNPILPVMGALCVPEA